MRAQLRYPNSQKLHFQV